MGIWQFCAGAISGRGRPVRRDIGGNRIYAHKGIAGGFRTRSRHTELFFDGHGELESVDRVECKPVRAEQERIVAYLRGRELEHQAGDQHFFDEEVQIFFRHKKALRIDWSRTH